MTSVKGHANPPKNDGKRFVKKFCKTNFIFKSTFIVLSSMWLLKAVSLLQTVGAC